MTLIQAITVLQSIFPTQTVTAIQFEDGSGYKFNVQFDGSKWKFINLTGVNPIN